MNPKAKDGRKKCFIIRYDTCSAFFLSLSLSFSVSLSLCVRFFVVFSYFCEISFQTQQQQPAPDRSAGYKPRVIHFGRPHFLRHMSHASYVCVCIASTYGGASSNHPTIALQNPTARSTSVSACPRCYRPKKNRRHGERIYRYRTYHTHGRHRLHRVV